MNNTSRGTGYVLKASNYIRRTIGLRLSLLFSAILILGFLILFVLAYPYLSSSLQRRDRRDIRIELNELATQYQRGGIGAVQKQLEFEKHASGEDSFFVRLENPEGNTVFLNIPDEWAEFDLKMLENMPIGEDRKWIEVPAKEDEEVLEVLSIRLFDGSLLRVGKNAAIRDELLENFRYVSAGILILFSFSAGALLAFCAVRPLRAFISTLMSIVGTGSTETRVPASERGGELGELSTVFNRTLERMEILIGGIRRSLDNVAHDLRTPMMRVQGAAEVALQSEHDTEALREALSDCVQELERIVVMLNTVMDISEAETGAMKLDLERVNISNLIEDLVELYTYVAEEKAVSVYTDCSQELYLIADRKRIGQIFANLLDNALRFTPRGGRVDIEAYEAHQKIVVRFKDTGIGIPPEELPRIWDRLYRGDRSRSELGLGLGLSLVKATVEAHRGHVEASNVPGSGSVFSVYLRI